MSSKKKFIGTYDDYKPWEKQDYSNVKSATDQRAILHNPQELYEQFVVNDEIMQELESEKLDDFDNDIYDYEDRAEYGEDVATAASLPPVKEKK